MIKVFVLIMTMSSIHKGSAIDHIEFDLKSDCEAAGQSFVEANKLRDNTRFICVTKNKVKNENHPHY